MIENVRDKTLPNLDEIIHNVYSSEEYQKHTRLLSQYIQYCLYTRSPFTSKGFKDFRAKIIAKTEK